MAVVDIKSAYRAVPIFPDHRRYRVLNWEIDGKVVYIEDSRLCFGLCLEPSYFDKISGFVYNILADIYNTQAVNYLDDFIVIGATLEEATWAQQVVIKILRYLGFYISWGEFKNKSVTMFTDNTQVMCMLRKGTSTNTTCMAWLREIFWIKKIFNIHIVAKYVNTKSNLVMDTLSRVLYLKTEEEARKSLQGSMLCCIEQLFTYCTQRAGKEG